MQTYDKAVIPVLVSTLADLLRHQPSLQILIAATIRNEQTFEAFDVACRTSFPAPATYGKPHWLHPRTMS